MTPTPITREHREDSKVYRWFLAGCHVYHTECNVWVLGTNTRVSEEEELMVINIDSFEQSRAWLQLQSNPLGAGSASPDPEATISASPDLEATIFVLPDL